MAFLNTALAMAPPFGVNVNGASTYPENNGNVVTLAVQAEQMDGSKGKVTVTAFSQGVPASEAFYRNSVKRCVVISGVLPPFGGEMQGMSSGQLGVMPGMPPAPLIDMSAPLLEVNLSYEQLKALIASLTTDNFNGDASNGYNVFFATKVTPALTENLTTLADGINTMLESIQTQLLDTVDPELGNSNQG